jgi:hypothetical protein
LLLELLLRSTREAGEAAGHCSEVSIVAVEAWGQCGQRWQAKPCDLTVHQLDLAHDLHLQRCHIHARVHCRDLLRLMMRCCLHDCTLLWCQHGLLW